MTTSQPVEMPFLDHLEELRWRIIWSLGALAVGVLIAFVLVTKGDVIGLLERPIAPFLHGRKLVYTHPGDPFNIVMSTSLSIGVVLALPVMLYQLWAFISPALHSHEKRIAIPVLFGATMLFLSGVSLAYFFVLPFSLSFLLGFQSASLEPMITASEYFNFATTLALAFGAVFELPILILALTALGIVTPTMLAKFRRHAFVLCCGAAAIITPGDLITSTIALMFPLYGLYEVSIWLSRFVHRRRLKRALAAERERDEAPA